MRRQGTSRARTWSISGFTASCPGCALVLRGTARQAHTETPDEALRGAVKSEAAEQAMRQYIDRAAKKIDEENEVRHEHSNVRTKAVRMHRNRVLAAAAAQEGAWRTGGEKRRRNIRKTSSDSLRSRRWQRRRRGRRRTTRRTRVCVGGKP